MELILMVGVTTTFFRNICFFIQVEIIRHFYLGLKGWQKRKDILINYSKLEARQPNYLIFKNATGTKLKLPEDP